MAYFKKTVKAGCVIEVYKYQRANRKPNNQPIPRAEKEKPTNEQVMEVNRRNAEAKLRWILNENFGEGDIHLVLTYKRNHRPTPEESRKHLEQFMRGLRRHFKTIGSQLKYISVTEYKRKAIHHHIVLSACNAKVINQLWGAHVSHGHVHLSILDNTGQYRLLAEYLIKETDQTFRERNGAYFKRWNGSKNLVHPKPKVEKISAKKWRTYPIPKKGYYIETDSVETGVNSMTGLVWHRYTMIKARPCKPKRKQLGACLRC